MYAMCSVKNIQHNYSNVTQTILLKKIRGGTYWNTGAYHSQYKEPTY